MKSFTVGSGIYRVSLSYVATRGNGLSVTLLGCNAPHIGGVAVAVPQTKIGGEGLTCDISQICLPGHKDVYAAAQVAKIIALGTNEAVSVSAGLHIDNATKDDIEQLMKNACVAAELFLQRYQLAFLFCVVL